MEGINLQDEFHRLFDETKYEEAKQIALRMLNQDHLNAKYWYLHGSCLFELHHYETAADAFINCWILAFSEQENRLWPEALLRACFCFDKLGAAGRILDLLTQACNVDPDFIYKIVEADFLKPYFAYPEFQESLKKVAPSNEHEIMKRITG